MWTLETLLIRWGRWQVISYIYKVLQPVPGSGCYHGRNGYTNSQYFLMKMTKTSIAAKLVTASILIFSPVADSIVSFSYHGPYYYMYRKVWFPIVKLLSLVISCIVPSLSCRPPYIHWRPPFLNFLPSLETGFPRVCVLFKLLYSNS